MELPTCPACGQSVLDDDVAECPFCGASMSGGTGSKTTSPAGSASGSARRPTASAPSKPPAKDKTAKTQKPQSAEASSAAKTAAPSKPSDDGDPFAVDPSATEDAVRLRRKPVKGQNYKVVCPMCETAGYVSPKAAGKEVRCANPKCLVPIFTAPEIPKKEPVEEEPKESNKLLLALYATLAVLLLAGGGGAWFFVFSDNGPDPHAPPSFPAAGTGSTRESDEGSDAEDQETEDTGTPDPAAEKQVSLVEIRRQALERMIETSREDAGNRSKPFCRRLTAEAFALAGDSDEVRTQLQQLTKVGPRLPFYHITPLVMVAWNELDADRTDAALQTVDEAWTAARDLPPFGRDSLDSATALATVLVAVGRADDAAALLDRLREEPDEAQLAAELQGTRRLQTFDLDTGLAAAPLLPWNDPKWVAVTLGLAARGHWDEALEWAERHSGLEERTDAVVAWAEVLADHAAETGSSDELDRLGAAAEELTPAGQARLYARVADRQLSAGDQAGAEQSLENAQSALDSMSLPDPFTLPEMAKIINLKLPDPVPLRMGALAAAEIARVQDRLGESTAAWNSLSISMNFARAMAPGPPVTQSLLGDVENQTDLVRDQLRTALNLDSSDRERRALIDYRRQLRNAHAAAGSRFQLQTALLSRAAEWGLHEEIWKDIRERAEHSDDTQREPFLQTPLPWILADQAEDAGAEDLAGEIRRALSDRDQSPDPKQKLRRETAGLVAAGNVEQAASQIEGSKLDTTGQYRWILQLACRLVNAGNIDQSFRFVRAVKDPLLREEAYELIAALAVRTGHAEKVWSDIEDSVLPPAEKVAVCRGLVAGLVALDDSEGEIG